MRRPKTETILALAAVAATAYLSAHRLIQQAQPTVNALRVIPAPVKRSRAWPFFVRVLLTVSLLSVLAVDFALLSRV